VARVLVVGASGLLGGELVLSAAGRHEVTAVAVRTVLHPPEGVEALLADCAEPGVAESLVDRVRPDWIVNCAAAIDADALETDEERADRLNHRLPSALAAAAAASGARLVHVSTDLVFDGVARVPYTEDDEPAPVNVYGRSKLAGERGVLAAAPDSLVARTTIYGWNTVRKQSLAEWFLGRLEAGDGAPGFEDAWFTPINTAHLAEAILELLERGAPGGVVHVAGAECVSKYEFGRRIARTFGYDEALVRPSRLGDHGFVARRTGWACMDSSRAAAFLGRPMPGVDAGLDRLRDDATRGRRAALREMGGTT
jgi:dTDP-4-dehydrorhamnose reductase